MRFRFLSVVFVLTILLSLPRFAHHTPDSKHYINLAKYFRGDFERHSLRTPFAYRVLIPFLVAHGPTDNLDFNFAAINVGCTVAAYLLFVAYLKKLVTSRTELNVATLMLVVSFPSVNYSSGILTDPAAFLACVAAAYLLSQERYGLFAAIVSLGILARESVLSMVLVALLYLLINSRRQKAALLTILPLVIIPPAVVLIAVRMCFSDLPNYLWVPSLQVMLSNLKRPISWLTVLLTLCPLLILFLIGVWPKRFAFVERLSFRQKSLLLSLTIGGALTVIYSVIAAFMSGRFFWPLYTAFIPVAVLASNKTIIFTKLLGPFSNWIFDGTLRNKLSR